MMPWVWGGKGVSRGDGGHHGFPATEWSLVERAGGARGGHLERLLGRYLPALGAYLRFHLGLGAEEAEDLLQSFVAEKVVEQNLIDRADQARGKFRTFLLCTLRNYAVQQKRAGAAARRMPVSGAPVPLEGSVEVSSGDPGPAEQFEIAWARQTIAEATLRVRGECERTGRVDVWTILNERVIRPALDGVEPVGYEELVGRLGLAAPIQACNLLTTGKRMFIRCLREVVADYTSGEDPDAEIAELRAILASAGI
jgi:RNA polymerase sigma-70 factor (ECF subfamily)